MVVSGDQVATLHAALTGDSDGYRRLHSGLDSAAMGGYHILVAAAFFEAASRRFGEKGTKADVVEFVGKIRAQYDLADEIDPRIAERLLLATFTDERIDDIPDQAKADHYITLLIALIKSAQLSASELDEFLQESRRLADEWLSDGS